MAPFVISQYLALNGAPDTFANSVLGWTSSGRCTAPDREGGLPSKKAKPPSPIQMEGVKSVSYSRIYFDKSLNLNADEFLEVAFSQLFHDNLSIEDSAALPALLDPYTTQLFGDEAISFTDASNSIETASKWTRQFGDLRVWRDDSTWFAKIGPDNPQELAVSHAKQLNVILLAGVQVLREYSRQVLNPTPAEKLM
jgi:hypothetical protein